MNLPFKLRRTVPVTALAALVLAIGASPALAAPGFSISISGPSTATVGKPVLLKVSGKNPSPAEYWFQTYMDVDAIPASVLGACPDGYLAGVQVAEGSWSAGGDHIAGPSFEQRDTNGYWSAPVSYTPVVPGKFLICAYSENVTNTLALAQHTIQVQAAGASSSKKCKKAKRGSASAAKKKCKRRK